MRLIKMFGLAAIAAVVAMAFIGASSASATKLCKNNPCTEVYPSGTVVKAELAEGEAILKGAIEVKCKKSTIEGKITENPNAKGIVIGSITAATWTECSNPFFGSCTVKAIHTPWKAEVTGEAGTGKGKMTVTTSGAGNPGAEISVCVGPCTVESASVSLEVEDSRLFADKLARVRAKEVPFKGTCGETKWTALYKVTQPTPIFFG